MKLQRVVMGFTERRARRTSSELRFYPYEATAGGSTLTTDPTVFDTIATQINTAAFSEMNRVTIAAPGSLSRTIQSCYVFFDWDAVGSAGGAGCDCKWQVGIGAVPVAWVDITDTIPVTNILQNFNRGGAIRLLQNSTFPFTLRLVGRVVANLVDTQDATIHSTTYVEATCTA